MVSFAAATKVPAMAAATYTAPALLESLCSRRRIGQKVADDREAQARSKAVGLRLWSIWLAGPTSASGAGTPYEG